MKSANAATLIYSDTGCGKTTLLATYFEWVYKRFKKKSRYYAGDLGGFGDLMLALQAAGIVEVCRFQSIDPAGSLGMPTGVCAKITQGYWPKEGQWDPESGLCTVGAELVAPSTTWFSMYCKQGHVVKKAQTQQQLVATPCPQCKVLTSKENCSEVKKETLPNAGFEDIGAVGYDSLTSMGEWVLTDLNYRSAKNTLGGMKGNMNTVDSAGESFGVAGMSAVGFAQNRIADWPRNAVNIPGLVVPPIFTALEKKAADSDTKLPIYGPQVPGTAKTSETPSYFGNCWPLAKVQGEDGREKHRLYLTGYRTPGDSIPHLGKSRVSPGALPEYVEDPDGATADNGSFSLFNLGHVFTLLEEAQKKEEERVRAKYPDAPGVRKAVVLKEKEEETQNEKPTTASSAPVGNPVPVVPVAGNVVKPNVQGGNVVKPAAVPVATAVVPVVQTSGNIAVVTPSAGPTIVAPPVIVRGRGVIPGPKQG